MPKSTVIPVRLSDDQIKETEEKQEAYNQKNRSDLIRLAIRMLPMPTK